PGGFIDLARTIESFLLGFIRDVQPGQGLELVEPGLEDQGVGVRPFDLVLDPVLAILAAYQDLEERIDGADVAAPEDGDHRGAGQRKPEPDPIGPGKSHEAGKILHGWLAPGTGLPKASMPPSDATLSPPEVRAGHLLTGAPG